jgi:hypothetical protein
MTWQGMTDTNTPKIDSGIVFRFMKEALKQCSEQGQKSYSALAIYTKNKLTEANFVTYSSFTFRDLRDFRDDDPLLNLLAECYQRLFISGYIIPETDKSTEKREQAAKFIHPISREG